MIKLTGLERAYQEGKRRHAVLNKLTLDVAAGEILVLLGRSGSGKSTLLNLISGIDLPDGGTVEVDGVNITTLTERERTLFRRAHIGFVFQFFNLIPTLSVLENVSLPLELNGKLDAAGRRRAETLIGEVGLAGREGSYPDTLSGGEQQRVAVARALAHDPKIVLADEPTGNLDKETGLSILELLDTQVRQAGKTMLMATHSREVMGLADRILTFSAGALEPASPGAPG